MSTKDIKEDLKQQGLKPGDWTEVQQKLLPGATAGQVEALLKLRAVLEELVAKDQKTVAGLREQVARLRHGGGR
jgi:hypothetical protein